MPMTPHMPMTPPPRDWHMELKEFVRQRMYSEMEPIRVQVALLHKQIRTIDEKTQHVALIGSPPDAVQEKKSTTPQHIISPDMEAWMDTKLRETNNRVTHAEGVLRELGALHDKFAQRHDSLVNCLQQLDKRVGEMDGLGKSSKQIDLEARKAPCPSVPRPGVGELVALPDEYIMPPHTRPGLGSLAGTAPHPTVAPSCSSRGSAGGQVWKANDQQASLEVEEFSFCVDRGPGMSLGMVLRDDGSKLVIDQINEGNTMPVTLGDRIVAIDGIRGESKRLLELIRRTGQFTISCQRLLSTSL